MLTRDELSRAAKLVSVRLVVLDHGLVPQWLVVDPPELQSDLVAREPWSPRASLCANSRFRGNLGRDVSSSEVATAEVSFPTVNDRNRRIAAAGSTKLNGSKGSQAVVDDRRLSARSGRIAIRPKADSAIRISMPTSLR